MRNQIAFLIAGIIVVVGGIFFVNYGSRPETPLVGPDGVIEGEYAIEGIMRLNQPYRCEFEKEDETSTVLGVIHTDGHKIYGEFRIHTNLLEAPFRSSLIVKDGAAYAWTSLEPVGFIAKVAKSAQKSPSPQEQAQIVGLRDKFEYHCRLWENLDSTYFNPPEGINFIDLR